MEQDRHQGLDDFLRIDWSFYGLWDWRRYLGARLFDLFTGQKSQALVNKKYDVLSKVTLFVLLFICWHS